MTQPLPTTYQTGDTLSAAAHNAENARINQITNAADWNALPNKPAVVAAGADQDAARTAIDAYSKPAAGIPPVDMEPGAQLSLQLGGSAVQFYDLYVAELIEINPQTADYTLTAADAGRLVEIDSATPRNVIVPSNSVDPIPVGSWTKVRQVGVGQVTIITGSGVTLGFPDTPTTRTRWCTLTLHKRSTNGWAIEGDAATTSAPPPASTVTFGAVNSGASESAGDGIVTFSYTPAANDNIVFVDVAVGKNVGGAASGYGRSVMYGSQPMSSLGAVNSNNSTGGFLESFYIYITPTSTPSASTVTVTVTGGAGVNPRTIIAAATSYAGVASLGTPVTGFCGTAGTPSVTVASAANRMVHAAFCSGNTIASPTDTQRVLNNMSSANAAGNLLVEDQAGAASAVLGAAANSDNWAWIGVDMLPGTPPPVSQLPDIASLAPSSAAAGTTITINGSNFIAGATVSFGGTAATNVVVVSANQITATAPVHADGAVNVTVSTSAGISDTAVFTYQAYTPDGSKLFFNGDFSTNNYSQWAWATTAGYDGAASSYSNPSHPWAMQIQADATYGKMNRVEVRDGDISGGSNERAELSSYRGLPPVSDSAGGEGTEWWWEHAIKFDANFPNNHPSLGFGTVWQWKSIGEGSPGLGWYVDHKADNVSLMVNKQSSPLVYVSVYSLLDIPLNRGVWHHFTEHWISSAYDNVGLIEVWHNQVRQTFLDGTQTHHVRTMVPGSDTMTIHAKAGYYRAAAVTPTGTVYHAGFRSCTAKEGLIRPVTWP